MNALFSFRLSMRPGFVTARCKVGFSVTDRVKGQGEGSRQCR